MRCNITVHVPQTLNVSYTLFAKGCNLSIPKLSQDKSEVLFNFLGGTVVILFYNFGYFKKAYAVTGWQDTRDGEPVNLPGVDGPLCVLFSVRGKKYHIFDKIIKYLTKTDETEAFKLPPIFWYRLGVLIDSHKTRIAYIKNLLLIYRRECKEFYYSKRELKQSELNQKILEYCSEARTKHQIADFCGYKNERAFAQKYLETLVNQNLLKKENKTYTA